MSKRRLIMLSVFMLLVGGLKENLALGCDIPSTPRYGRSGQQYKVVMDPSISEDLTGNILYSVYDWGSIEFATNMPQISPDYNSTRKVIFKVDSRANWVSKGAKATDVSFYYLSDDLNTATVVYFTEAHPENWSSDLQIRMTAHELGHFHRLGEAYTSCSQIDTVMLKTFNELEPYTVCPSTTDAEKSIYYFSQGGTGTGGGIGEHNPTPIIIDLSRDGIRLTDLNNGVQFDLDNDGITEQISWTEMGSNAAFLVFDRNGDGVISNGTELFGNFTPQPESNKKNGFLALAEFDKEEYSGNGNGFIDPGDFIFSRLYLWTDRNHDGISEPNELTDLSSAGINGIPLEYKKSGYKDSYGNVFRYWSRTDCADKTKGIAVDVFLLW